MQKGNYLSVILRSEKTVFSSKDIALLWHESNTTATRVRLHYFVKKGDLVRIRKGLYAKNRNYNKLELATRILTPAYVSFETVLFKEGLIFQYYDPIFVGIIVTLLGLLWFLQGTGIIHLRSILCVANCEPITEPSLVWAVIGAVAFVAGVLLIILGVRRKSNKS